MRSKDVFGNSQRRMSTIEDQPDPTIYSSRRSSESLISISKLDR